MHSAFLLQRPVRWFNLMTDHLSGAHLRKGRESALSIMFIYLAFNISRSSRFKILPMALVGRLSKNTTILGTL